MCYHFINDMEEFSYQIQEIFGGIKNEQLSERQHYSLATLSKISEFHTEMEQQKIFEGKMEVERKSGKKDTVILQMPEEKLKSNGGI